MKAIAVIPGKPNSIHLREAPKPSLDSVPNGRGVLVKILRVGVDGTVEEMHSCPGCGKVNSRPAPLSFR